ncbi:MAG: stage II sporulation protein R [Firmicutes bacterium]|nr:stage II sporulation protein R [Bacillota bacterium]
MKRLLTVFFIVFFVPIIILTSCAPLTFTQECDMIRIHIVANSNSEHDQEKKYIVRDAVKIHLEESLHQKTSIQDARSFIRSELNSIQQIATQALNQNNSATIIHSTSSTHNLQATVRFSREFFPTRAYSNLVVESGYFYALTITLGNGLGNNWWCVIYPPLCYLSPIESVGSFRYRSIILEWFRR